MHYSVLILGVSDFRTLERQLSFESSQTHKVHNVLHEQTDLTKEEGCAAPVAVYEYEGRYAACVIDTHS